jgi:DNA polymerase V
MEITEIMGFAPESDSKVPLFSMAVYAGKAYDTGSETEYLIDLNEFLVEHPASTFFVRAGNVDFKDTGICEGDLLVTDSSLKPTDGKIVVVLLNNELTLKTYRNIDGKIYLQSDTKQFLPIKIEPYLEFKILGVVTRVIHEVGR